MSKTILYRLFRIGGIPRDLRPVLEAERIVVSDEGIGGWYITPNLKAPGRRSIKRREGFSGFLTVTKTRMVCYTYGRPQINIAVDDPRLSKLYIKLPEPQILSLSFESSVFHKDWKGLIEFRFHTGKALEFYEVMRSIGILPGSAEGE
ncbi:MAG: hypothetical protein P8184_19595 [Calditrichia bacterium]